MPRPSRRLSTDITCASSRSRRTTQLDLQAIHRVRDRLVARRTSEINQLRAFLLDRGMTFAKTPFKLKQAMPEILQSNAGCEPGRHACATLVSLLWSEWKDLEQQLVGMNQEIEQIASSDLACQRLRQIPWHRPVGSGDRDRRCHRQRSGLP